MTEQWLLLRDALRNLVTVICQEPGPIRWLILIARRVLLWYGLRAKRKKAKWDDEVLGWATTHPHKGPPHE